MQEAKLKFFQAQEKARVANQNSRAAQTELENCKANIAAHPEIVMNVSDHAMIQFLTRALKQDFSKFRSQLLDLCDNCEYDEQNRNNTEQQYVYKTLGPNSTELSLIVKNNMIVTYYVNDLDEPPVEDTESDLKE